MVDGAICNNLFFSVSIVAFDLAGINFVWKPNQPKQVLQTHCSSLTCYWNVRFFFFFLLCLSLSGAAAAAAVNKH